MIDYTLPLDQLPDPLPIEPLTRPFDVTITPPGSKSITCRAYVLAALAEGESRLIRPLRADDTDRLLDALCTLGAQARWEGEDVLITGVGGRFPRGGEVNLGDGGTPTRFMIACACLAAEPVVVDGSPRMRDRPIAEGVEMLRQLGAHIEYVEAKGRLPVRVVPSDEFTGGVLEVGQTASSQFVSALLLIGASLPDGVKISFRDFPTSASYLSLTIGLLKAWNLPVSSGLPISSTDPTVVPTARARHRRKTFSIEPDASSAVYWWLAASIVPGAVADVPDIRFDSAQPDALFVPIIRHQMFPAAARSSDLRARGMRSRQPPGGGFDTSNGVVRADMCPDAAVALAVYAAMVTDPVSTAPNPVTKKLERMGVSRDIPRAVVNVEDAPGGRRTRITGLHTLRVKETDRIAALANELRKVGCTVETTEDSITITPAADEAAERGSESRGTGEPIVIETYNDHRVAMAFAVLGLVRPRLAIRNPACVAKSYPGFWRDFAKLYGEGTEARRHEGT